MAGNFKINPAGVKKMYEDAARRLKQIDAQIRRETAGQPPATVLPAARQAFKNAGVNLTDKQLKDYSDAVAQNKPYNFVLQ